MQSPQQKNTLSVTHKNSTHSSQLLKVEHEFQVPVKRLFEAFKTSDAIKAWWWPNGLSADKIKYDFREGGDFFITMKGKVNGTEASGGMAGEFKEIVEDKLIIMSDQFADDNGHVISAAEAKMSGMWPEFVFITLEFTSIDENSSRVNLSQEGIPNEMQKDCVQGWTEMFDKLENYLGALKH